MDNLFLGLFLLSALGLVVGLIKPSLFRLASRKIAALVFGGAVVGFFILFGITAPPASPTTPILDTESTSTPITTESASSTDTATPIVGTTPSIQQNPVPTTQPTYYSVTQVVDGDTLKISMNGSTETLRMIGIDTPETVDPRTTVQCFGKEASDKAKSLLTGKKIRIELDASQGERDKYNRLLAYVYRDDGLFFNDYMVKEGYAHEYTYNLPYKYQAQFKANQKAAQADQKGLWSPNTCNGNTSTSPTPPPSSPPPTSTNSNTSGFSCSANIYNCDDFTGHTQAQSVYEMCGGVNNDVHGLDRDKNGLACE